MSPSRTACEFKKEMLISELIASAFGWMLFILTSEKYLAALNAETVSFRVESSAFQNN